MREKIKDYDRLLHIQESIDNVFEFMEGKTIGDLAKDRKFKVDSHRILLNIYQRLSTLIITIHNHNVRL